MPMALLNMADFFASIHKVLREDGVILELMGLVPPADFSDAAFLGTMAVRIQKRKKPRNLSAEHFPAISFYSKSGRRGGNPMEYAMIFNFDVYTGDDVETAILIAERITQLFEESCSGSHGQCGLKGQWMTNGEAETDLADVFKFFTQVKFTLFLNE